VQRQLLDRETALVRFVLGGQRSYLWLVTARGLSTAILPPRAEIDSLAKRVHELVSTTPASRAGDGRQAFQREAERLSAILFGPVAGQLAARRLLIVSDGLLQFVPFAALPQPGSRAPMIAQHEIVMLPSASMLAVLRGEARRRVGERKTLFVFADPVYESTDPRVERTTTASSGRAGNPGVTAGLATRRLPFSRREANSILSLVPASDRGQALGFEADRDTATGPGLRDYRIVHFAAHARLDDTHPELSGLVLSLVDSRGEAQDGLLRLHEIYNRMSLRADLVVLSACETAIGADVPGEGLMGLARGFFAAGAARIVASLYKVDDDAASELMTWFYEEMLTGERQAPAAALRAAQLKMLGQARWQDPYWWSGFAAYGEPEAPAGARPVP
jgi:CHAT domain-containing protein